jgi:hypothetical protein
MEWSVRIRGKDVVQSQQASPRACLASAVAVALDLLLPNNVPKSSHCLGASTATSAQEPR